MKKFLSVVICFAMLLSVVACGENASTSSLGGNADFSKDLVSIVENGESKFTVIRAREGTKLENDLAVSLRSEIEKKTGVSLKIANDNKGDPTEFEILVGQTNRQESKDVYANLKEKEFVIKWVGKKLVIAGDGDMFLGRAYTYFINNFVANASSTLGVPEKYDYSYVCLTPEEQLKQTALVEYSQYPEQIKRDYDYEVTVSQGDKTIKIPVYNETRQINNTSSLEGGDKYRRFCEFAFSGDPVTISVKVNVDMQSYVVAPSSKGYQSTVKDNVITFTVNDPGQIVLKLNRDQNTILSIFADQVELDEEIPNEFDENVIYYGAGWHDVEGGSLKVGSGKTLYLAPGAVLNSRVTVEGENVKVMGRGMIRDPFDNRMETSQSNVLNCVNSTNLTVQDVKLVDARAFNFVVSGVKNATVKNLKCLSNQVSTDGISFFGKCDNILVENCFLHVTDNMFVFGGEATNYTVRNCVVGSDYTLFYPQGNVPKDTLFENIDAFRCSSLIKNTQPPSGGKSTMENVIFKNIRLVDVDTPLTFFYLQSQGDTTKKFTLQNVAINSLKDYQAVRAYDGSDYEFVFDNVFIGGNLFTSMSQVAAEDNLKDTVYNFTSTNDKAAAMVDCRKEMQAENKAIKIYIGNYKLDTLSTPAFEENGNVYVAIKDLLEQLGYTVTLDGETLTHKDSRATNTATVTLKDGVAVAPVTFLTDNSITKYTYDSSKMVLKVDMINRGENLIKNPGFEEKFTANWCTYNHTRTFLSKEAHSGEYSVEINKTFNPVFGHGAAGLSHYFTDILERYGTGTYRVECFAKLKDDTVATTARIGFVESGWQILTDTHKTVELSKTWQKISYEFTFSNISDYSSYNVFVGMTQGDETYFYVDDFTLTKVK